VGEVGVIREKRTSPAGAGTQRVQRGDSERRTPDCARRQTVAGERKGRPTREQFLWSGANKKMNPIHKDSKERGNKKTVPRFATLGQEVYCGGKRVGQDHSGGGEGMEDAELVPGKKSTGLKSTQFAATSETKSRRVQITSPISLDLERGRGGKHP